MDLYDPEAEKAWCTSEATVHDPKMKVYKDTFGSGHRFVSVYDEQDRPTGRKVCWFCGLAFESRAEDRQQPQAENPDNHDIARWEWEGGHIGLRALDG